MGFLTFLSDFGTTDHYVASVKAKILTLKPEQVIVDISHDVEPFNIAHGLHVINSVFQDFPEGTVHLLAVDTHGSKSGRYQAALYKGHYFVCADNGLLSLLTEGDPRQLVDLPPMHDTSSPARDILAPAAVALANGSNMAEIGELADGMVQLINRQLRLNDHSIIGHVVHVDHYGNLITDITRDSVDAIGHGRHFTIHFNREVIDRVSTRYNQPGEGDCVALFNRQGYLTIGINKGHASELLGMFFDSPVEVHFVPDPVE
ncbi:SAM hydrolase/SAM-dependent halogenase family protein [Rufibacter roseus]|uniref:S-adenosyl-l-methionine hydroxide adenosyltransferase family protein n=1 Tax=Rufibacter roseus TaxID=1567108 RepID=A0ABW2DQ44_9BACT|nr:SAM-dependent chlorinase/fluorinase [Rufibacter roseus]